MRESWLAEPWLSLIVAGGLVALTAVLVLALTRSAGLGPTPRWPTLAGPRPDEFPVWDPDEVAAAALALPPCRPWSRAASSAWWTATPFACAWATPSTPCAP